MRIQTGERPPSSTLCPSCAVGALGDKHDGVPEPGHLAVRHGRHSTKGPGCSEVILRSINIFYSVLLDKGLEKNDSTLLWVSHSIKMGKFHHWSQLYPWFLSTASCTSSALLRQALFCLCLPSKVMRLSHCIRTLGRGWICCLTSEDWKVLLPEIPLQCPKS